MSGRKLLVTGAAGFIGAHIVAALRDWGYAVIAVDRRAPGSTLEARIAQDPGLQYLQGELTDVCDSGELPLDIEGVVHAASTSRAGEGKSDPDACMRTTVLSTSSLLKRLRSSSTCRWVLLLSSREVDRIEGGAAGRQGLADVYAIAKQTSEALSTAFCREAGWGLLACRLSDVYGTWDDHANKLLPSFVRNCLQGSPLSIHCGAPAFSFTHIYDVARAVLENVLFLDGAASYQGVRRLWSSRWHTAVELAALVDAVVTAVKCGTAAERPDLNFEDFLGADVLPAEPWCFRPRVSLEAGIADLARRFLLDQAA